MSDKKSHMINDGKKFNILYLHNESVMGGAEISLLNLVKRLNKKFFIPHFACSKEGPFIDELRKIEILPDFVQFPSIRLPNPVQICNTIRTLIDIIKKRQIDLIHSNQPRSNLFGAIAAKIKNVPIVWHERCLEQGRFDSDNIFSFLPDKIICNSDAVRNRFTKGERTDAKIRTIINGVDLREFNSESNGRVIREEFNIDKDELVVGTIGRIDPEKGYECFLESARIILEDLENVRFLIVGGASNKSSLALEKSLYEMSVEKGIDKNTIFTGFRRDIPQLLASMDVVVLPSGIDACSRVLFEAMAMQKPLVATNAGGTPEIVQDGITGLLTTPGDSSDMAKCIIQLLQNKELAKQYGKAGRKRVEELFTIERNIKETEYVYLELLDTNLAVN
ncbi:MAG: glycosyltransferase family 4 protein [Candidatus Scalindua sp.]|nr:glycosyltransferase family 4 protein [Candidatus Scalindua sp.]MBT6052508.1 glycosyltransferase family 4 protein [Candidatus Scalindua sp.]MBT6229742.1 glycosyltransferase family 4 protein [Candidatus Scalindua sp.]MBT6562001.1 glycosyltransferase family 4 protein [Candidatus Scalindua sp.]MBT7210284.1 glycosyltransferase family 4 protein [Candidatus Scalindua sp.]